MQNRIVERATVEPLPLELVAPFRIAHGTSTERTNALVRIGSFEGEAALPPYYGITVDDVASYVETLDFSNFDLGKDFAIEDVLASLPDGPPPAMAAVDMALYDAWACGIGLPLHRLLGLSGSASVLSSFAQSIPNDETAWRETLAGLSRFPILKLKLGSGDLAYDEEVVRIAGESFPGRLAVDANAGWRIPDAVKIIPRLADLGVLFVEQPIPDTDPDDWHLLRRLVRNPGVPLIADESVRTPDDVVALAGAADGVNLKLAKCGGIRKVRTLIAMARALHLRVMLGCMIESSLSLTAMAHLASLADFLDLDAMLHLAADPFTGVSFEAGRLVLPGHPGIGARRAQ